MLNFKRTTTRTLKQSESLTAVKDHLRIPGDWVDAEVERCTLQAIHLIEERTRTTLLTQSYVRELIVYPTDGCVAIPRPPIVQVDSIQHDGESASAAIEMGNKLTHDGVDYELFDGEPAVLTVSKWPELTTRIKVAWTAGVAAWTDLSPLQHQAILLVTHHLYHNRDGSPLGVGIEAILDQLMTGDEFTYAAERVGV